MVKVGILALSPILEEKLSGFHHCVWRLLFHIWNMAFIHGWQEQPGFELYGLTYAHLFCNKYSLWSYTIHSWLSPWVQNCRCRASSLKLYTDFQLFMGLVSLTALFMSKVYGFCYLEFASFYSYVVVFLWWKDIELCQMFSASRWLSWVFPFIDVSH